MRFKDRLQKAESDFVENTRLQQQAEMEAKALEAERLTLEAEKLRLQQIYEQTITELYYAYVKKVEELLKLEPAYQAVVTAMDDEELLDAIREIWELGDLTKITRELKAVPNKAFFRVTSFYEVWTDVEVKADFDPARSTWGIETGENHRPHWKYPFAGTLTKKEFRSLVENLPDGKITEEGLLQLAKDVVSKSISVVQGEISIPYYFYIAVIPLDEEATYPADSSPYVPTVDNPFDPFLRRGSKYLRLTLQFRYEDKKLTITEWRTTAQYLDRPVAVYTDFDDVNSLLDHIAYDLKSGVYKSSMRGRPKAHLIHDDKKK